MLMMEEKNRRSHERLPLKLAVICQKVGVSGGQVYTGNTVNVSPGGILLEINSEGLCGGDLVSVDMSVPPAEGFFEYGGRFSSYARVVRVEEGSDMGRSSSDTMLQTIALEFCELPKLRV